MVFPKVSAGYYSCIHNDGNMFKARIVMETLLSALTHANFIRAVLITRDLKRLSGTTN